MVFCGDLNVAHEEIDLKNPKSNQQNAGFTREERDKMTALLDAGFIDTFRYFYPEQTGAYSWWSYMFHAREKNAGRRIDYWIVSQALEGRLRGAAIHPEIFGSDHCPVELTMASGGKGGCAMEQQSFFTNDARSPGGAHAPPHPGGIRRADPSAGPGEGAPQAH